MAASEADREEVITLGQASSRASTPKPAKAVQVIDLEDEEEEFEVEKIVDHKTGRKGETRYFLKWKGFASSENTWEPEEGLLCDNLMVDYWMQKTARERKTAGKDEAWFTSHGGVFPDDKGVKRQANEQNKKSKKPKVQQGVMECSEQEEERVCLLDESLEDWTPLVREVRTVEECRVGDESRILVGLVDLENNLSWSPSLVVQKKCPSHLFKFYESHLKFNSL